MSFFKDLSVSSFSAGFVAVLVGFTSSAALVFQAASELGATPAQIGSWMLALCLGIGVSGIYLSWRFKAPVVTAWSTPGAAVLVTAASSATLQEATGAFVLCGLLMALCGFFGWFERIMQRIPPAIAAGMLAGVLLRFGMEAFAALATAFSLVFPMLLTYLLARRLIPRYAVMAPLVVGIAVAAASDSLDFSALSFTVTTPQWVTPAFSVQALMGVALPLFAVCVASQNLPGLAVMRAAGYQTPASPLIGWTGLATFVLAPFGAFGVNLAAITAAICTGPEAHDDPAKRYTAAIVSGLFYLVAGIFGASIGALFLAFPKELVLAIAGFALINTIGSGLVSALQEERHREAALVTFLVTASGVSLLGIASAFWGMVAGAGALLILQTPDLQQLRKRKVESAEHESTENG
ncbi:benzoate/H(+) symporter BenE family transporter [Halopseudomonas bauzanensis]|uniref:Benzoate membrane transport protein n=1 Tax=Halopseudomonas bauzanensis TaxID=653930 RepID=A0A031MJD2_9GAMM|nr:benzoate/H(+) symporter BenE family transporter [Halopseudomonas bauzanensis]EZQ19548.1 membrane protein [Halopseudomonas bauzanensis]SER37708.1 benzoate membrane transport protein [Halopseudomonas bauzanensis]SFL79503.1 benzoate membrane transport protein [Halopseudomonas bauzanensis]